MLALASERTFAPFTLAHGVAVLACVAAVAAVCLIGKRYNSPSGHDRLRLGLGVFGLVWQLINTAYFCRPSGFDWGTSLPLQICDITGFLAPLAMLTRWRVLRSLVYFFGFGLSTQAFITPIVRFGPESFEFWIFWVSHSIIVGYAVIDLVVLGYRPSLRDLLTVMAIGVGYVTAMMGINQLLSAHRANYGFVGDVRMSSPTLIDRLGPWPLRVVWMGMIANAGFVLLWAVWPISRRVFGSGAGADSRTAEGS